MPALQLKPAYKAVRAYYDELHGYRQLDLLSEGAVSPAFAALLRVCAGQVGWTLAEQFTMQRAGRSIRVDGALLDPFKLVHGVWEAKDSADDLDREVRRKFEAGYPRDNILFQAPRRAILWQDGQPVLDEDISQPPALVAALKAFFAYQPPAYEQWERAVDEFKLQVPQLAAGLLALIAQERRANPRFGQAFGEFDALCRQTINPNLSPAAVEEMLIQHLLTERIFRRMFDNPDFAERNVIAREIEKVVQALTAQQFSRHAFFKPLDRFYGAIETTAATIDEYAEKQAFLNTVYEKFFQGFSVKVADTHGIVYTPQPIVAFMVRSVEDILQREFGRSLSDEGVHVLDPFVGTGNFILRVMRAIRRSRLPHKYAHELHCNEVLLLPYYIAAMNIEHEYYDLTGAYQPFEGLCLVDTFELAEDWRQMSLFAQANTERVERQKAAPIFVAIGNPPYNAGQINENDNNKNRQYPAIDQRVSDTYGRDSQATLLRKLNDPYIKAIRWASDRIGEEGIVAFVTNNSFISEISFDGMRKHLAQDFDAIYVLDLGGNVRKNPKLSGTTHNVFGIQVGVSISFLVRHGAPHSTCHPEGAGCAPEGSHSASERDSSPSLRSAQNDRNGRARIYYARVGEDWRKEQKYDFLDERQHVGNVEWQEIQPDARHNWLTEGMSGQFDDLIPLGIRATKGSVDVQAIFQTFSLGVSTNRDSVVYDFDKQVLASRVEQFCEDYNAEVMRYQRKGMPADIDSFVSYDKVKWSSTLKRHAKRGTIVQCDSGKIRVALYRPFTRKFLYYDPVLNDRPAHFQNIFPTAMTENENRVICVNQTTEKPFACLITDKIPNLVVCGGFGAATQCFPFYVYDEDGGQRRENVTDWALAQFRAHYDDDAIGKWDIFHYVYALLHHPQYRERYAANLRRALPRLPYAADFWGFARAGARLAALHVGYEEQAEYPLQWIENPDVPLSYRVDRLRIIRPPRVLGEPQVRTTSEVSPPEVSPAPTSQLVVNDFLTLAGIPAAVYDYRLGHRSALEWVVDQYRVSTDRRSGLVNDPNRPADPPVVVRLIGQVITVSLATVEIVNDLPALA